MAIQAHKPTTPGRRGMTSQDRSEITTRKPLRSLIVAKRTQTGRNNQGRITTRHKGGGARRFYRLMNFNLSDGVSATIEHIEYDPNRSARIARIKEANGTYHYILAAKDMHVGQVITSGEEAPVENGNRMPLKNIPVGSTIHAIEMKAGRGAQMVRSAGSGAQLMAKEGDHAQVRLPSGEVRLVRLECTASLGVVGNEQHQNIKYGKAGRMRHKGIRPTVRGVVMNAVDHKHGGGDGGRHGIGKAQRSLGRKTRTRKSTAKMIIKSRHAAKRK